MKEINIHIEKNLTIVILLPVLFKRGKIWMNSSRN